MRVIEVNRKDVPADWSEEHTEMLENGHKRGVVSSEKGGRKVADQVVGFASRCGVGLSVFGGLTFVGLGGRVGNGPVRFQITG